MQIKDVWIFWSLNWISGSNNAKLRILGFFPDNLFSLQVYHTDLGFDLRYIFIWNIIIKNTLKFPLAPMGVLAHRLRTLDRSLVLPSTRAEIFRRTCLQSHLQISPPTPQKSYQKFRNPRTNFEIFKKNLTKT